MDLARHILQLLAPTEIGGELLEGVRLVGASTELGPRLTFSVQSEDLHIDVATFQPDKPFATRSRQLMFSYRSSGDRLTVDSKLAFTVCEAVARRAATNEDRVLAALRGDAAFDSSQERTRVREVRISRLLEQAGSSRQRYYTLSPYVGCLIGCRFCYAQGRVRVSRALEALPEVPWGSYVDVRINAPDVLEAELANLGSAPLKFCPIVSDPYQAVEKRYQLTRACLSVITRAHATFPTFVLTRSVLMERDIDVLVTLNDVRAGVSLPTIDDDVRKHFEPRASPIHARLAMLAKLGAHGVKTFAVVQPMLPGDVVELADALARCVSSVSIDVLHGVEGAVRDFEEPRYAMARDAGWQRERAERLREELGVRGVAVWSGELPPDIARS